jgi:hypothetical protein
MKATASERVTRDYLLDGQRALFNIHVPARQRRALRCPAILHFVVERLEPNHTHRRRTWLVKLVSSAGLAYLGKLDDFTGQVELTDKSDPLTGDPQGAQLLKLLNHLLVRIWCDDHEAYEQHGFKVTPQQPFIPSEGPGYATILPSGVRWTGD